MTGRKIILVLAVILLTAAASGAQSLEPQPPAAAVEAPTLETPVQAEPALPLDPALDWMALTCESDCYALWENCFDGCDISPYPNCYHDCRMGRGQCLLGCP